MTPAEEDLTFWTKELRHYRALNFVYVIQGELETPIKVGQAKDVRARMAGLQTGNPQRLRLLHVIPGDGGLEWSLHQRLKGNRVNGEWFAGPLVEPFLEYVARLTGWTKSNYRGYGKPPDYRDFDAFLGKRGEIKITFVEPSPKIPAEIAQQMRDRVQGCSRSAYLPHTPKPNGDVLRINTPAHKS